MIKISTSIAILFAILTLHSCNSNHRSKTIDSIDSLSNVLTDLKTKIENKDINRYQSIYDTVKTNIDFFKEYVIDVPTDTSFTHVFYMYGSINKAFKSYFRKYTEYKEAIKKSETQLLTLKNDIKSKVLKKEEFTKYFTDELTAITKLERDIHSNDSITAMYKIEYDRVYIRIQEFKDSLANSIKEKNK